PIFRCPARPVGKWSPWFRRGGPRPGESRRSRFPGRERSSSTAFEATGEPLGKARGPDFCGSGAEIVRNAKESECCALKVRKCVTGRVVTVARLARGADDGEPLAVLADRNGGPRHWLERHRSPVRADEVQFLLVHV